MQYWFGEPGVDPSSQLLSNSPAVNNSSVLSSSASAKGELKVSKKTGKLLFKVSWINNWLEKSNEN